MPIPQPGSKRRTIKAQAMTFLAGALANGPAPATQVGRLAREQGLTAKGLRTAREALGIKIARHRFGPGSASVWSLPNPQTKDGHEIHGLAGGPCDYCDGCAGPPGPQSGPVYLVRNPFTGNLFEPLHEDCARSVRLAW